MLEIHPEDAAELGIRQGDPVAVALPGTERVWPATLLREQPRGTLHAALLDWEAVPSNPCHVAIRKADPLDTRELLDEVAEVQS
jgi:anaerobic selenocysteine-containing dehydrogenase